MKGNRDERMAELIVARPVWEPQTIWSLFCETALRYPKREFLVYEDGRRFTYADVHEQSLMMQKALVAFGVKPGDVVAFKSANRPESVMLSLALSGMRAVKANLNPGLGAYELAFVLRQSNTRVLFTDAPVDFEGQDPIDSLASVVTASHEQLPFTGWAKRVQVTSWAGLLKGSAFPLPGSDGPQSEKALFTREQLPGDKIAYEVSDIMFTSGSTGNPKGALLSHDMLLRSAWANCLNRGFEDGRRIFVPLPLFHVYGYVEGLLAALFVGGTLLMLAHKVPPAQALDFMVHERAHDVLAVPSLMLKYLTELADCPREFPDLHAVYCSASAAPDSIWPDIRNSFGVDDIITGYGMTEVSGASLQTKPGDSDWILTNRVGAPMPCGPSGMDRYDGLQMEYRLVDPDSNAICESGAIGELQCRGAIVCYGYCNDEEAALKSFTPDGWFKTGDTGRFDEDGYLELAGRIKDSYKINGENVSTRFVETAMQRFGGIDEVNVVGIPDVRLGAVGAAFVQFHDDTEERRESFKRYCEAHLARYQVPKYYCFVNADQWPRTPSGKTKKEVLREWIVDSKVVIPEKASTSKRR